MTPLVAATPTVVCQWRHVSPPVLPPVKPKPGDYCLLADQDGVYHRYAICVYACVYVSVRMYVCMYVWCGSFSFTVSSVGTYGVYAPGCAMCVGVGVHVVYGYVWVGVQVHVLWRMPVLVYICCKYSVCVQCCVCLQGAHLWV